jgi:uncharacterized protein (DUF427 family)
MNIMPKAIWKEVLLAESDDTEVVEGNHYFPPDSLNRQFLRESAATSVCGWKGTANYYDVVIEEQVNEQAAWYYPDPMTAVANIKGYVAFWKGVEVKD